MKTEYLPLVIALVAAAASVSGIAFTQYGAVKLDRQKWEQARTDAKRKSLEDAVFSYARDLGGALQQVQLLTWMAKNDPVGVTPSLMLAYESGSIEVLAKIAGHRLVLAAQDPGAATATDKAANAFYGADECISKASVAMRENRDAGLVQLRACSKAGDVAAAVLFNEFRALLLPQPPRERPGG